VLERILASYTFDKNDPLDVLCKVGGFEIGGMAGLYLGAAANRIPVVADGVISCVAALLACKLAPAAREFIFPSHLSKEPAGVMLLDALDMKPCITAGMHLGEGTGAVALMPLLDLALGVYHRMSTFTDVDIMVYEPYDENENNTAKAAEHAETAEQNNIR
jgi:nicotinate-nucleotide--dimethylbenzimidazole phosphoribosyltransferase